MNTVELYSIFLKHSVITTDSRNCPPDSIFFALRGEKFDGNDYIEQALNNGAALAVGDKASLPQDKRIIRVDDVLQSLQSLANYHRTQLNAKIIAITGTNGKTTTKELVAAALSAEYPTLFTQGNLNNHIGVPLTLLQLKPEHRFAVIEMGANHPGEIRELCRIADPDFGLITNIGKAHLEGFGSLEGVIRTKTELYDYLREKKGIVFGNCDNPTLKSRSANMETIAYGTAPDAFVRGQMMESEPTLEMNWSHSLLPIHRIKTQLVGSYNFENVLAAVCVAVYFGVETAKINRAIAGYVPQNNRSQILKTEKNQLIVDAYNANPSSMQVALDNFMRLKVSPKMLILGEMCELGEYSLDEHQKLIDCLQKSAIDKVILCGESFQNGCSIIPEWPVFRHTQALLDYLRTEMISGYHILIKGSRANQLEKTIAFL